MNKAKYVMTNNGPIVFYGGMQHSHFASYNPTSAGFVWLDKNDKTGEIVATCFGESVSLKLKVAEEDSFRITRMFSQY